MLQLDQVAFFSQFFWPFLFDAAFYIVILRIYLLSRTLKFRKKKAIFNKEFVKTTLFSEKTEWS